MLKRASSLAVLVLPVYLAIGGDAAADYSETRGGIRVVTEDGRFEARLGGRIHFDGSVLAEDETALFGSPLAPSQSGFYFRRLFLGMNGKAYDWKYKVEANFANNAASGDTRITFREAWFGTAVGPGELQIGQRRPLRGMEELGGSNAFLMIERPFASSAGGMFGGGSVREFQNGLFYVGHGTSHSYTWGAGIYSLRAIDSPGTEGIGESARFTWTPLLDPERVLHLGVSLSDENPSNDQSDIDPVSSVPIGAGGFRYGGFRGPTFNLGTTPGKLMTLGLEYAMSLGPWFAQGETMYQVQSGSSARPEQQILAWYLQGSWFITGETKPYRMARGVFGNPLPKQPGGAWEVTGRIESASAGDPGYRDSSCSGNTDSACSVSALTLGVNYYATPNVRFMLNYMTGSADRGGGGTDSPTALTARAQMAW